MVSILAFVHIILCVFLVVLVLIQDPKGGAAGGMFGGSSNSLFGATGAPTFMARLTRWVAVLFASFCIIMTMSIKPKSSSVLDAVGIPAKKAQEPAQEQMEPAPQQPAEQPAPQESTPPPQ